MLYMLLTIIPCIIGLLVLVSTVFWIWMLLDCITNRRISEHQKIMWVLVVLFTHIIGAIFYFFIARSPRSVQNIYQPYAQPQAPYNPYYQPNQQGYQAPPPYQQGYQAPPPPYQQGAAPPYPGYQAAPPYQQGYQQQQRYPTGSPPPQPPLNAAPPPVSSLDYEQPQAMYPHEQEQSE